MQIPCDTIDKNLFAACSSIKMGNGETAFVWTDRWLNGEAPATLAPDLYKLAYRKKFKVKNCSQKWGLDARITTDDIHK